MKKQKIVNKVLIATLFTFLFLLLSFLYFIFRSNSAPFLGYLRTYKNNSLGFVFKYPANIIIKRVPGTKDLSGSELPFRVDVGDVVVFVDKENEICKFVSESQNFNKVSENVGDVRGFFYRNSGSAAEGPYQHFCFEHNGYFFTISGRWNPFVWINPPVEYDEVIFYTLVKSFKFL